MKYLPIPVDAALVRFALVNRWPFYRKDGENERG